MAMDPNLITNWMANWQTPQMPDLLTQYAKIQALKNGVIQQQLSQQQLQNEQLQAQALQFKQQQQAQDLADQRTLIQAAQDPATLKAMTSWQPGTPFPLAGKIQWNTQQAIQDKILADQKTALALDTDQRTAANAKRAEVTKALNGLMFDQDGKPRADADIAADAPGVFTGLMNRGVLEKVAPLPPVSGFKDAERYAVLNDYAQSIHDYASGAQKEAQARATAAAQASEATAKADEATQTARKAKMTADAMDAATKNPEQGAALIDAAIPPTVDAQANSAYKAAWQAAMRVGNLDGAAQIVATAAAHAASLSPATTAQEVRKAVQIKQATAPIEVATEVAKQKALAANSPEMFAGITDVSSRRKAQDDYNRDTAAYYDKAMPVQQLKDFITAYRSGNKAAAGLIPMSVVRSIVNRVSTPELQAQVGGSVVDKVQGWFTGKTEGMPIPKDIIDGMDQIADTEARNVRSNYESKVNAFGATYGGNVRPAPPPGATASAAAQPAATTNGKPAMGGYQPGHRYGNLIYLGGDPNQQANWK